LLLLQACVALVWGQYLEEGELKAKKPFVDCFQSNGSVYEYPAVPGLEPEKGNITLSDYRGKVLLLVNVATY